MRRKFIRNQLRKQVGSKNLKWAWERFQMKKYEGEEYHKVCRGYSRRGK